MAMQSNQRGRAQQTLIRMLRPENVGSVAHSAITWLKPPAPFSELRSPDDDAPALPATLGRLGPLEACLAQN
jgi:hypothetical protein